MLGLLIAQFGRPARRFAQARRGAVAVSFAITALTVLIAIGSGIDLSRAYVARQQLSAVATLACQYANRPDVAMLIFGSGRNPAYISSVDAYLQAALAAQNVNWTQTTTSPFAFTTNGTGPGTVNLTASVPTAMMAMIGITSTPISLSSQCFSLPGSLPQPASDFTNTQIVSEGFENIAIPNTSWYLPTGIVYGHENFIPIPAVNTPPTNAGYIGLGGNEWIVMGYCLEVDAAGITESTVPDGSHSAELDCDNGSSTAGNSSISTRVYLATGAYELRWS